DPSISGSGNFVLSYTITNGSCISKDSITATVTNTPVTTITNAPAQICESASAFQLQAVDPNGTWSGTGITDAVLGTFDPAVANQGTHTITYSITANGCSSSSTISIQVDDLIVPTI